MFYNPFFHSYLIHKNKIHIHNKMNGKYNKKWIIGMHDAHFMHTLTYNIICCVCIIKFSSKSEKGIIVKSFKV